MSFANIGYLPAVAVCAFVALVCLIFHGWRRRRIVSGLFPRETQNSLILSRSEGGLLAKEILLGAAILLCAVTVLRPQWGEHTREVRKEGSDLLVVLDVSRSMNAADIKPSRLSRAKDAIRFAADSLKGDRAGIVLFAGSSFLQCPLTADIGAFHMFLDSASSDSVSTQGTDIGKALKIAGNVFKKKKTAARMMLLISDGEDNEGAVMSAVDDLKSQGVTIFTAGIGRSSGELVPAGGSDGSLMRDSSGELVRSKKNEDLLRKIADATGGSYSDISDSLSGISAVTKALRSQQKNDFGISVITEREERYYIPAFLLVLLLLTELVISDRRRA
jgi:Ca-activated chloride channel family protein